MIMDRPKISQALPKVILAAAAFICIGWADTWDGIKAAAGKVTSVSAEFTQEKHMKILSRPLVSGGAFHFQAPNSLRWEYQYPVQSALLMHNGKTKRYIRRNGKIVEDAGASLQTMQVVLQEITLWMRGRFDENPMFSASLKPDRKIVLSPKEKALATIIQRIELILSERAGMMESVTIYEDENSFTRLEFKNVVQNRSLEASLFREF